MRKSVLKWQITTMRGLSSRLRLMTDTKKRVPGTRLLGPTLVSLQILGWDVLYTWPLTLGFHDVVRDVFTPGLVDA